MNKTTTTKSAAKVDRYQAHDYYLMDELLSEDHILARDAVRDWVKQEVSPIIEEHYENGTCHNTYSRD